MGEPDYNGERERFRQHDDEVLGVLRLWGSWLAIIGAVLVVVVTLYACARPAHAHGAAEWIQRGNYKNYAGELCCGERDCGEMVGGSVEYDSKHLSFIVRADFNVAGQVIHVDEVVPESEAAPSPDGNYWRCQWGGQRKCFFAPPPNT